jgi:hypothetical protein
MPTVATCVMLNSVASGPHPQQGRFRLGEDRRQHRCPGTLGEAWENYKQYFLHHQFRALQHIPAYPKTIALKLHEIEAAGGAETVTTRRNKAPGAYSFALWDRDGWAAHPDSPYPHHEARNSEGFAYLDNQHLRAFYLQPTDPRAGRVALIGAPKNQDPGKATYLYHLQTTLTSPSCDKKRSPTTPCARRSTFPTPPTHLSNWT